MTRSKPLSVIFRLLFPVLLCFLVLAPLSASGQDEEEEKETPAPEVEPVLFETTTVRARGVNSSGSAVEVIDEEGIEQRGASDLAQLLRGAPGVFAVSGARSTQTPIQLRGGDPNFALVLFDGVPLNDSTDSLGGAVDLTTITTANIERVEVVRGSSSWFYGSSALSGVLQVLTRDPQSRRFVFVAGAGDHDQVSGSALLEGPVHEKASLGLVLGHDEEQGRVFDSLGLADRFDQDHGLLRLRANPRDSVALRGSVRFAQTEKSDWSEGSGGPLLGSGEVRLTDQEQIAASLLIDFGKDLYQQVLVTFSDQEVERNSPAVFPVVPPSIEDTSYRHARAAWRLQAPAASWLLGGGAEVSVEEGKNRSLLLLPDFFGGPLAGDYDSDRDQGALFVEAIRRKAGGFGDLTVELGSRVDLTEGTDDQVSPHFGLSYSPSGLPLRLRASFGRSFKLPSFYALSSPRALGGNAELLPETATGGDLGIELDLPGGAVVLGLAAFSTRYEDLVDFDFETFQLVNRSEVDAQGLEAKLIWRVSRDWALNMNATAQEVEDGAGVELLRRPDWYGGAQLSFSPTYSEKSPVDVLLELEAVGEAQDEQVPVGRNKLAGYEIFNLAGSYRFNESFGIRLRLDNLLDERYQTQLGFPGPGRTVFAGLRFER